MGFFGKLKEGMLADRRGDICAGLQSLGVDAQLAAGGRTEEKIGCPGDSLGIIDIPEGSIRWINIWGMVTANNLIIHYTDYGVPDLRLESNSPGLKICSVRVKTFPLIGKVVDLHWKGKDFGMGIIGRLNSDISIKHPIMRSRNVEISAHGDHRCWIMSTRTDKVVSEELWNCYQAIARHLLAEWSPS